MYILVYFENVLNVLNIAWQHCVYCRESTCPLNKCYESSGVITGISYGSKKQRILYIVKSLFHLWSFCIVSSLFYFFALYNFHIHLTWTPTLGEGRHSTSFCLWIWNCAFFIERSREPANALAGEQAFTAKWVSWEVLIYLKGWVDYTIKRYGYSWME